MFRFEAPKTIFFRFLVILIFIALLGTGCSNSIRSSSQSGTTSTGTVVENGIVSESSGSTFTLLTEIGRLIIKYDSNTVSESIDLKSGKTVTGPVNANNLYQGAELSVEYNQTNNLAVKIVFRSSSTVLYTLISGTIDAVTGSNITLNAVLNGYERTLLINFDSSSIIIIKTDGSPGNLGDLSADMNIEAYCSGGSTNAAVIVIQ